MSGLHDEPALIRVGCVESLLFFGASAAGVFSMLFAVQRLILQLASTGGVLVTFSVSCHAVSPNRFDNLAGELCLS